MNPITASLMKGGEVCLLFPFHRIIHYQHIHNQSFKKTIVQIIKREKFKGLYKGISFQLCQSVINRCADVTLYNTYGVTPEAAMYSSAFKALTYPLHTMEIYYQMQNKYIFEITKMYNGYSFFMISNALSYLIWWHTLDKYNNCFLESKEKYPITHKSVSGFCSGLTVDLCVHPLRVMKTNLQNQSFNAKDIAKNFSKYGYRGFGTKLLLSGIQSAIFNVNLKT